MEQNPMFSYSLPDTHEFIAVKKETTPRQKFRDALMNHQPAVFIKKESDPIEEITNGN